MSTSRILVSLLLAAALAACGDRDQAATATTDSATTATDASGGVKLPEPVLSGVWGTALVCL